MSAFRIATAAWLVGWFAKAGYYVPHLIGEARAFPVASDRLPAFACNPTVALAVYLAPLVAVAALLRPTRGSERAAAIVLAAAASIATVHLETFSDATFVTSLWSALWLVWLGFTHERRHARILAQCVIALQFLGPVVGKLTTEWTSGDALYHLYFLQKDEWPYPALRAALAPARLHDVAGWAARIVIATELALVLTPLLPRRAALAVTLAGLALIVATSTWMLVSVVAGLAGLALAAATISTATDARARSSTSRRPS